METNGQIRRLFLNSTYHYIIGTSKRIDMGQDICSVEDNLGETLKVNNCLGAAPFQWIGGSIIFQLRNLDCFGTMTIDRISKKYGRLKVHSYPDYRIFHAADALCREVLLDFYKILSLNEIIAVGKKYSLPTSVFEEMLLEMGSIPVWTEEMGEPILDPEKEGGTWNDKWMQTPQLVIDRYNESVGIDTSSDERYLKFHVRAVRR